MRVDENMMSALRACKRRVVRASLLSNGLPCAICFLTASRWWRLESSPITSSIRCFLSGNAALRCSWADTEVSARSAGAAAGISMETVPSAAAELSPVSMTTASMAAWRCGASWEDWWEWLPWQWLAAGCWRGWCCRASLDVRKRGWEEFVIIPEPRFSSIQTQRLTQKEQVKNAEREHEMAPGIILLVSSHLGHSGQPHVQTQHTNQTFAAQQSFYLYQRGCTYQAACCSS